MTFETWSINRIEYNERNSFFQKLSENEAGRLVLDLFLFFRNT